MMTSRSLDSIEDALDRSAGLVGYARLAKVTRSSAADLRRCADPWHGREISFAEAIAIDQLCLGLTGEAPFLDLHVRNLIDIAEGGPAEGDPPAGSDIGVANASTPSVSADRRRRIASLAARLRQDLAALEGTPETPPFNRRAEVVGEPD